jgi:hypothetical protein
VNPQEKTRLSFECTRWLIGHPRTRHTAQAVLADLAAQVIPACCPTCTGKAILSLTLRSPQGGHPNTCTH